MALAAALAVLSCAARSARAEEQALPVSLSFQSEVACPDDASFLARIHARTPLRASREARALRLHVTLLSDDHGFRGQLRTGDADGNEAREVVAASCEEVADALALIGALIVERTKREHAERPQALAPPPASPPPVAVAPAPPPRRRAIALGAEGFIARPMSSTVLAGLSVSMLVDGGVTWWLSAGYGRNDFPHSPGKLRLGYGSVTLGMGPPSLRVAARVQLAAAVAGEGGFLAAEGVGVDVPASVRRSYWALGLLARLQWQAVEHGYLFVQGAGLVPLVERGFSTREPYERVGTTARVAPKVGAGIALGL